MGAFLNVKINVGEIEDKAWMANIQMRADHIQNDAKILEREILENLNREL